MDITAAWNEAADASSNVDQKKKTIFYIIYAFGVIGAVPHFRAIHSKRHNLISFLARKKKSAR